MPAPVPGEWPAVAQQLLLLWPLERCFASAVQRIAHSCVLDGNQHKWICELPCCGAWGMVQGKNSRDLMAKFRSEFRACAGTVLNVPCLDLKSNPKYTGEGASVLMPRDMFQSLAVNYNNMFQDIMGPTQVQQFWSEVREDDFHWTPGYPSSANKDPCCIPFGCMEMGSSMLTTEHGAQLEISVLQAFQSNRCSPFHGIFPQGSCVEG